MKGSIRLYIIFLGTIILSLSTDELVNGFERSKDSKLNLFMLNKYFIN
jgi:hypothetical protein